MRCFACDTTLELAAGERVGFRDSCSQCGQDLHVCHNCAHHDPAAYNECREPNAEWVSERERANRCEYFAPGTGGQGPAGGQRERGRDALEGLFRKK